MKKIVLSAIVLFGASASAQQVSYEAFKAAELLTASGWQAIEQSLPTLISGLESQLRQSGASENAAKVLSEEARKALSKDNLARVTAAAIAEKLTQDELKRLVAFFETDLGVKYLRLSAELATDAKTLAALMKPACDAAKARLGMFDRGSINGVCGSL